MNTPSHVIFALAAFGRRGAPGRNAAAVAGGLAPDLSLYLLAGWAMGVRGATPGEVFGTLYPSDTWQAVFAVDNSFVIWGVVALAAWAADRRLALVFAAAALLHLALDFPVHHDDARRHFWPLTDWVFVSPVSYWDTAHHGGIAGRVELAAALVCLAVLWRRHADRLGRRAVVAGGLTLLAPDLLFRLIL